MVRDVLYSSNDVMEFFFGDELLEMIALYFLDALLKPGSRDLERQRT
jgi:hypothetical protein